MEEVRNCEDRVSLRRKSDRDRYKRGEAPRGRELNNKGVLKRRGTKSSRVEPGCLFYSGRWICVDFRKRKVLQYNLYITEQPEPPHQTVRALLRHTASL